MTPSWHRSSEMITTGNYYKTVWTSSLNGPQTNVKKCMVMHFGKRNKQHQHYTGESPYLPQGRRET
jgi:hypothetical protein